MKLQVYSDLHLEFGPFDPPKTDADVIILAGDIDVGTKGVQWAMDTFDKPVIYVFGNHEYYHNDIYVLQEAKQLAKDSHVHVLENEALVIDGVKFLGATLWTDFNLYGPEFMEKAMRDAAYSMNDYRIIKNGDFSLSPQDTKDFHAESKLFLEEEEGADDREYPLIVVTHHGPTGKSIHQKYKGSLLNAAYASELTELIANIQPNLWIHGHVHNSFDYQAEYTRVITNPRGYVKYEVNPEFNPEFVIDFY